MNITKTAVELGALAAALRHERGEAEYELEDDHHHPDPAVARWEIDQLDNAADLIQQAAELLVPVGAEREAAQDNPDDDDDDDDDDGYRDDT